MSNGKRKRKPSTPPTTNVYSILETSSTGVPVAVYHRVPKALPARWSWTHTLDAPCPVCEKRERR